jgi:hypothetical protein
MQMTETLSRAAEKGEVRPNETKRVAISQSNYIPWKGYFDLINSVDEFVILDDVQFTKCDWRNRNRVKSPEGAFWLSIPIRVKGRRLQKINQTQTADPHWAAQHWKTIESLYARAKYFEGYKDEIRALYYANVRTEFLTEININFLRGICDLLGIKTRFRDSREFRLAEGKTERLLDLCRQLSATSYVCGPRSRDYLEERRFRDAGIDVVYMDYSGYPEYPQLFGPFLHEVSIIDLIFNAGEDAAKYMKTTIPRS